MFLVSKLKAFRVADVPKSSESKTSPTALAMDGKRYCAIWPRYRLMLNLILSCSEGVYPSPVLLFSFPNHPVLISLTLFLSSSTLSIWDSTFFFFFETFFCFFFFETFSGFSVTSMFNVTSSVPEWGSLKRIFLFVYFLGFNVVPYNSFSSSNHKWLW